MDTEVLRNVNQWLDWRGARYAEPTPSGDYLVGRGVTEGFVLDLETGEEVSTFPATGSFPPTVSSEGSFFATVSDGFFQVRQVPGAEISYSFPYSSTGRLTGQNALGPGGETVFLEVPHRAPGVVGRYSAVTGQVEVTYRIDYGETVVTTFAASSDGSRLALAGALGPVGEGFVSIFDAVEGDCEEYWETAYEIDGVALSPDGSKGVMVDGVGGVVAQSWSDRRLDFVYATFVQAGDGVLATTGDGKLVLFGSEVREVEPSRKTDGQVLTLCSTRDASVVILIGDGVEVVTPDW